MRMNIPLRLLPFVALTLITITIWSLLTHAQTVHAAPATFNVDTTVDDASLTACTAAPNDCSLRGAIIAANGNNNPLDIDIINVPAGTYTFAIPSTNEDAAADGDLDITQSVNIIGAGAETTIIQAAAEPGVADDRVFHVLNDVVVEISGVTVRHGSSDKGGGIYIQSSTSGGSVILSSIDISNNQAGFGGAIHNSSGLAAENGGDLTVVGSNIYDNVALASGGGIYNFSGGVASISNSAIFGNQAHEGGGIYNSAGDMSISNSTISNNRIVNQSYPPKYGDGGSIKNNGTIAIRYSTISDSNIRQGLFIDGYGTIRNSGLIVIQSTIIVSAVRRNCSNDTSFNTSADIISDGYNLSSDTTCTAFLDGPDDLNNVDPMLEPLGHYGGRTWVHSLDADSSAINLGYPDFTPPPDHDQRGVGFPRVVGGRIDIGAFEWDVTASSFPVTFDVDTTVDDATLTACTPAPNDCSLRGAIIAANTNGNPLDTDIINVPAGIYTFAISSTNEDAALDGDLDITQSVNIIGAGVETTIIQAATEPGVADDRVFHLLNWASVALSSMTIRNGTVPEDEYGGGVLNAGRSLTINNSNIIANSADVFGGGIFNATGSLAIDNSRISQNTTRYTGASKGGGIYNLGRSATINSSIISLNSSSFGGGIHNTGIVTVSNGIISANSVTILGGGIDNSDAGELNLNNSTVSDNIINVVFTTGMSPGGGGIHNGGELIVNESIIVGNNTYSPYNHYGGGILNLGGNLIINNSTLSGNRAQSGGGIYNTGTGTVISSTISDSYGEGIYNRGSISLKNTIIARAVGMNCFNGTSTDSSADIISEGYNLSSDMSCTAFLDGPGDLNNIDPMLGPLGAYGGKTRVHGLYADSPAINAGDPSFIPPPNYDQRGDGFSRVIGGRIDIGAFEWDVTVPASTTYEVDTTVDDATLTTCTAAPNDCSLRGAIIAANNNGAPMDIDIINIPSGTYTFAIPSTNEDAALDGDLDITQSVNIIGAGAETTIIQAAAEPGGADSNVISIMSGVTVQLSGVKIRHGQFSGIYNVGNLHINNSVVSNNRADNGSGGGIYSIGNLSVNESDISDNYAYARGGGIYNTGNLIISSSMISNNTAYFEADTIYSETGNIVVNDSVISNSSLGILVLYGSVSVDNSTISGSNDLGSGGIYSVESSVNVNQSVITNHVNTGISNRGGNTTVTNSMIVNNGYGLFHVDSSTFDGTSVHYNIGDLAVSNSTISGNQRVGILYGTQGNVVISNSNISDNEGQGINSSNSANTNSGNSTISNSTISGNRGGIYLINGNGNMTIISSNIFGNTTGSKGGGIFNQSKGSMMIINSSIFGNTAVGEGGGIYNYLTGEGSMTIGNSTISNNRSYLRGGGILNASGSITIHNSTIAHNNSPDASGVYNRDVITISNVVISNIEGNVCINDITSNPSADIISNGYNLSSDTSCVAFFNAAGDLNNVDPLIGPLDDYGGVLPTHALFADSPAINAGDPNFVSPPDYDQRGVGFPRVTGGRIDIGAFESIPDMQFPPVAINDQYVIQVASLLNVSEGQGVIQNDFDINRDGLTAILVAAPQHAGSFTLNPDGSFSYSSLLGFYSSDSFTYQLSDGESLSNVATVVININLLSPNGVVNSSLGNLTYQWPTVYNATTYTLYVHWTGYPQAAVVNLPNLADGDYCDGETCTLDVVAEFGDSYWLGNGDYTAWIKADNTAWTQVGTFTIQTPEAAPPTVGAPTDTDTLLPTMHWTLEGEAVWASWFQVYLDANNYLWVGRDEVCGSLEGTTCTFTPGTNLTLNGTYTFWIRGWGPGGTTGWVSSESFKLGAAVPSGLAMSDWNAGSPMLNWDEAANSTWYQVWIGTESAGVYTQHDSKWFEAANICAAGTCEITLASALPGAGPYEWWMRSWGPAGYSAWVQGPDLQEPAP